MIKKRITGNRSNIGSASDMFFMDAACFCLLLSFTTCSYAQFNPNFIPDGNGSQSTSVLHGEATVISGQTPFLEEFVSDPNTGHSYYHLLIGNPAEGFAQDIYIRKDGYTDFQNGTGSASKGTAINAHDVFGSGNGSNTGNPNKVIVRQILNDGEIAQEFLKNKLDKKPKISQMLNTPDISLLFIVDMSNSTYTDNSTAGMVINSLTLVDPGTAEWRGMGIGDFSMLSDGSTTSIVAGGWEGEVGKQNSQITAGRYIYTPGETLYRRTNGNQLVVVDSSGAGGTYTYLYDSFDPFTVDVNDLFDFTEDNPWTYTSQRPRQ